MCQWSSSGVFSGRRKFAGYSVFYAFDIDAVQQPVTIVILDHDRILLEMMQHSGVPASLHPCLRDICAALLYIYSLDTPPEFE